MKTLRLIIALLLVGLALGAGAQVTKRSGNDARGKKDNKKEGGVAITDRQQSFYEVKEPHDADLQWMKVIYRSIDLTKGKNAALYYPEIPNEDGSNLYFIIMRLLANNQLAAYEYLPDGREMFTEEYRIKDVGELFTRFQLYFTEAKGSTEKNPLYEFEDADIRGNEVLCYYIIEKWEFDTRSNQMRPRVEALCPVMVQVDDFTGESMQTYQPDLGMLGMPYLIQSDEQMEAVLEGEVGDRFEQLMEDCGMKVLGYFTRGPRYITSNKKIESLADMKNLLIRTPQSPMTVAAFEATGAKPTPMALNEVFTSLQQGTIEAQENPMAFIESQSFYEVQKYLIKTAHLRSWVYIAMGKAQFDALPEDLQQVVLDGGKHAQEVEHELFLENEEKFSEQLQEQGMEFVDVDVDEFAEAMVGGVLPTLTDSQKEIYEAISALKAEE